jgi:transcriptional regulator with XRE-family HTH domain
MSYYAVNIIPPIPAAKGLLRSIGERARDRRIFARLSQADLARRSGVSRDTVVRMERGDNVGLEALVLIAITLDAATEFAGLFPAGDARSLDDILAEQRRPQRVRSRRIPH